MNKKSKKIIDGYLSRLIGINLLKDKEGLIKNTGEVKKGMGSYTMDTKRYINSNCLLKDTKTRKIKKREVIILDESGNISNKTFKELKKLK
jgi:hypothetical protein